MALALVEVVGLASSLVSRVAGLGVRAARSNLAAQKLIPSRDVGPTEAAR